MKCLFSVASYIKESRGHFNDFQILPRVKSKISIIFCFKQFILPYDLFSSSYFYPVRNLFSTYFLHIKCYNFTTIFSTRSLSECYVAKVKWYVAFKYNSPLFCTEERDNDSPISVPRPFLVAFHIFYVFGISTGTSTISCLFIIKNVP